MILKVMNQPASFDETGEMVIIPNDDMVAFHTRVEFDSGNAFLEIVAIQPTKYGFRHIETVKYSSKSAMKSDLDLYIKAKAKGDKMFTFGKAWN